MRTGRAVLWRVAILITFQNSFTCPIMGPPGNLGTYSSVLIRCHVDVRSILTLKELEECEFLTVILDSLRISTWFWLTKFPDSGLGVIMRLTNGETRTEFVKSIPTFRNAGARPKLGVVCHATLPGIYWNGTGIKHEQNRMRQSNPLLLVQHQAQTNNGGTVCAFLAKELWTSILYNNITIAFIFNFHLIIFSWLGLGRLPV